MPRKQALFSEGLSFLFPYCVQMTFPGQKNWVIQSSNFGLFYDKAYYLVFRGVLSLVTNPYDREIVCPLYIYYDIYLITNLLESF